MSDMGEKMRVLVVGDVMVDVYAQGFAKRVNPEFPCLILTTNNYSNILLFPGGAANVAANIRAFGAEVTLAGVVGGDLQAHMLKTMLNDLGVQTRFLPTDNPTITKIRFVDDEFGAILLRWDLENVAPQDSFAKFFAESIDPSEYDAVVVSDYNKGTITSALLTTLKGCKLYVDAKPKNKELYKHLPIHLLKINRSEAVAYAGVEGPIELLAREILKEYEVEFLLITLGSEGAHIFGKDRAYVPVEEKEARSVAGAGDVLLAYLVTKGVCKKTLREAIKLVSKLVKRMGTVRYYEQTWTLEDVLTSSR